MPHIRLYRFASARPTSGCRRNDAILRPIRRGLLPLLLPTILLAAAGHAPLPAAAQTGPAPVVVWIEGESAARTNFNRHSWYCCDGVRRDLLSPGEPETRDGEWLAHYTTDGRVAEAEYRFDVPPPAAIPPGPTPSRALTLWLRASAYTTRMWYRLDGGPRVDVDTESEPREYLNLLVQGRIDIRFLAWLRAGTFADVAPGPHTLVVGLEGHPARQGGRDVHGGIDVVALSSGSWTPTGALRPSATAPAPRPADWFPLVPSDDPFDPRSITDVSALLHRPAGARGPVERAGSDLRFADGTPARFWGVNASIGATPEVMERQARWYAKHGINLVRLHPVQGVLGVLERDAATGARRLNPARLERLDRWFATLKAHGIYMQWSPVYPHVITPDDGYPADLYAELPAASTWGLPAGTTGKSTSGFVNVMPALQDAEWEWIKAVLDHTNPYTGLRYADDPALAIVEVHNEDSIFWHYPLNALQGGRDGDRSLARHQAELQRQWLEWLRARYPTDADLRRAWGPVGQGSRAGDSLTNPRIALYGAWEMAADGPAQNKAEKKRMGDFIAFLAGAQREYFRRRGEQLREIGFKGATVSTAWQAGGPAAVLANLFTDDALDMIDRHRYFGGHAESSQSPHRIATGAVRAESHLAAPGSGILGAGLEQLEDKPFMLSEWTQSPPNQWKAEIAPLYAFYGMGLQGWDASTHFATRLPRMGGGWPNDLDSYVTETPHYIGQFPALARAVLRGDIAPAGPAAARRVRDLDIFKGVDAIAQPVGAGWRGVPAGGTLATPAEALAIGRVSVRIVGNEVGVPSDRADWDTYWDRAARVVRSMTGELAWDYGNRIVTVAAPRTQAVIGFAGGRTIGLPGASIAVDTGTPFLGLILTALDDRPIATSGHILVTALARDRQTGARYSADGSRLDTVGGPPLLLEPVQARITFAGGPITSARPLDIHGVPVEVEIERAGNRIVIDGRYATYYYEVRRAVEPVEPTGTAAATAGATATVVATRMATSAATVTPTASATAGQPVGGWAYLPVGWKE